MEFLLRYFIDGNEDCEGRVWSYTHAARMIIPRIGERVWVDDNTCVDVECHDITEDVLAQYDDEEEDY